VIRWICSVTAGWRVRLCQDGAVDERKRYPSDLTDERRALIEPVIGGDDVVEDDETFARCTAAPLHRRTARRLR